MKKTTIAILLLLPMLLSANPPRKTVYNYRPAPQTGEWMGIAGIGLMALSATVLQNDVAKAAGYVGGAMVSAGVVIDLNGGDKRKKVKIKFKRR